MFFEREKALNMNRVEGKGHDSNQLEETGMCHCLHERGGL